jgi:hypothetical protein
MADVDDNRAAAIAVAQNTSLPSTIRLKALRIVLRSNPTPGQKAAAKTMIAEIVDAEAVTRAATIVALMDVIQDTSRTLNVRMTAAEFAVSAGLNASQTTTALTKLRSLRDNSKISGEIRVRAIRLINRLV